MWLTVAGAACTWIPVAVLGMYVGAACAVPANASVSTIAEAARTEVPAMDRGELIAATLGDGAYRAHFAPGTNPPSD